MRTATAPGGGRGNVSFVAFFEAALVRCADFFPAHHHLVHAYEEIGMTAAALRHAEIFLRLLSTLDEHGVRDLATARTFRLMTEPGVDSLTLVPSF